MASLKPVARGSVGELVVTGLNKRHMPIIRYRVGDLGRWADRTCECGREEPLFEILGRCDDRIHVGGAHLFVNDIQNALGGIPELSFNFQAIIGKKGHKDTLRIRVEAKSSRQRSKDETEILKRRLMRGIEVNCGDLAYCVTHKWLDAPEIEILSPGAIERVLRTGKIRRVIDKRIQV
jgi:phenylacetate-coenzyme A ligase PaaK-like adenylate-forming protein